MDAIMEDAPLNFDEPEHVRMLRDATRRFVEAEMPREKAREWDRGNIYPADVMKKLGAMGMMGLTVEERYGGAGVDIYATMAVIEEIAKRSVAVACPYIMAVCYAGMNLGESASEEQKQDLLPKVASGNLLFAYGLSEAALADAWRYAEEREQFGRAIAGHQAIRHTLADAQTRVRAMRLMLYSAAWLADRGRPCSVETSMAKLFCCEGAAEVTQMCMRVTGAYGLSDQMDMERYVRDAVSLPIVGGSSNMQKNNIANRLKLGQ